MNKALRSDADAIIAASLAAVHLSSTFYGTGVWVGSVIGFTVAYLRLQWIEKNLDEHMFCRGNIMPKAKGIKPKPKVLDPEQREGLRQPRKQKRGSRHFRYAGTRRGKKQSAVR